MKIELQPRPMTPEVMADLEARGLIIRLCPGAHDAEPGPNEAKARIIYSSEEQYGPHKLIVATINSLDPLKYFGDHADQEEFLFIGDPATRPLYLVVALHKRPQFEEKIRSRTLSTDDFVALRVRFNDPYASFFTMLKEVLHGEVTVDGPGKPASFYVTEPRDVTIRPIDMGEYTLEVLPEGNSQ
jgi:hypothetical protein